MPDNPVVGLDRRRVYASAKTRLALLGDAQHFASELAKRLEQLERVEAVPQTRSSWQQAAAVIRATRGLCRHEADEQRRRRRAKAAA